MLGGDEKNQKKFCRLEKKYYLYLEFKNKYYENYSR
jgi:hypothetical protein